MVPFVSIIICTRNRADSLRETLASIARCEVPPDLLAELIVVDNGSTDHTRQVAENVGRSGIPVRYFYEEALGQCYARNRGLVESHGTILLWTDDDVRVPINWIEGMCRPIMMDEVDAVQGNVSLPPKYRKLANRWQHFFAVPCGLTNDEPAGLVGANMAFNKRVLERIPFFDIELGPGALGFGDETLFSLQMKAAKFRLKGLPEIFVEHHFQPSRIKRPSFRKTVIQMAQSGAYIDYHWKHHDPMQVSGNFLRRLRAGLFFRRVVFLTDWGVQNLCPPWEKEKLEWIAVAEYSQKLIRTPRKYDKFGLVKRREF